MRRTSLNLEEIHYEWLRKEAYVRKQSMSEVVRDVIEHAMKTMPRGDTPDEVK